MTQCTLHCKAWMLSLNRYCPQKGLCLKGMNQHKRSSAAGVFLKNVTNSCDHFCVFEKEAVSYMAPVSKGMLLDTEEIGWIRLMPTLSTTCWYIGKTIEGKQQIGGENAAQNTANAEIKYAPTNSANLPPNQEEYSELDSGQTLEQMSLSRDIRPELDDALTHVSCNCTGSCKRNCQCKVAAVHCKENVCRCPLQKCSHRPEQNATNSNANQQLLAKRRKRPYELQEEHQERAESAYNEAKEQCSRLEKDDVINRVCLMAKMSPLLWKRVSEMSAQIDMSTVSEESPLWCVCDGCRKVPLEKERVCCKNKEYGHQNPLFEHHVLFEPTLELAMRNNADHLHYPFDRSNNACWRPGGHPQCDVRVWSKEGEVSLHCCHNCHNSIRNGSLLLKSMAKALDGPSSLQPLRMHKKCDSSIVTIMPSSLQRLHAH
eukprot:gene4988-21946_t